MAERFFRETAAKLLEGSPLIKPKSFALARSLVFFPTGEKFRPAIFLVTGVLVLAFRPFFREIQRAGFKEEGPEVVEFNAGKETDFFFVISSWSTLACRGQVTESGEQGDSNWHEPSSEPAEEFIICSVGEENSKKSSGHT